MKNLKLKNVMFILLTGVLFVGSSLFISGCDKSSDSSDFGSLSDKSALVSLTSDDSTMLLQMREEEKLARDVYDTLYVKYGLKVFDNISSAEQRHMDAVKMLLDTLGLSDPALSEPGVFTNPALQELYNALISQGAVSLVEALKVGATIEDLDIYDLEKFMEETNNQLILETFQSLTCGSRNHMRAFNSQLVSQEVHYTPVYISQEEFDDIINSTSERCGR